MSTPPFPTPPRAITHAELLAELEAVKLLESAAEDAERVAEDEYEGTAASCDASFYQGQRHLLVRLIKKAERGA